jgi:hypothetical protein
VAARCARRLTVEQRGGGRIWHWQLTPGVWWPVLMSGGRSHPLGVSMVTAAWWRAALDAWGLDPSPPLPPPPQRFGGERGVASGAGADS